MGHYDNCRPENCSVCGQARGYCEHTRSPRIEPFVVKHYSEDERPSIKGNGFDGLSIGEDRQEAEEFVAWINARLR